MTVVTAEDAFSEFYTASYRRVLAHAYSCCSDVAEAQDITQEAYARLWPRWQTVSRYDEPVAWVMHVAHNLSTSRWRRATVATRAMLRLRGEAARAAVPEPSGDSVALVSALHRLPEAQRRALALHYLGDQSVAAIAVSEGVAEGTIKARLSRGRVALAAILAETPPVDETRVDHG